MISKIVYAEDEKDVLEIVQKRLVKSGFEFYPAENGQQAYDLILKHKPDLIVTDIVMPIMNGFELCKELKNNNQTKEIPIIVLSAKKNMQDAFFFLGIKDFLSKPFSLDQLEERIKERLNLAEAMHTTKTKIIFHSTKSTILASAHESIETLPQWAGIFVDKGSDVLNQVVTFIPDVIVLDLFMEDGPINECILKIKFYPELSKTKILTYYSPVSTDQDELTMQAKMIEVQYLKQLAIEAGAKEYLGPFNPSNFMSLLNEYRRDSN